MTASELPADHESLQRPASVPIWRKLMPLIGLLLLGWIVSRLDISQMRAAMARLSASAVMLAVATFGVNVAMKTWRWQRLLRAQGIRVPGAVTTAAFLSGQFYGQVTVGRLGEFYRAEALVEREVPAGTALSSCLFDRALDLAVVVLVGATLGAFVVGREQAALVALVVVGVPLGAACLTAITAPDAFAARLGRAGQRYGGVAGRVFNLLADLVRSTKPLFAIPVLLEAGLWTLLAWFAYFAALWILAGGLGLDVSALVLTAGAALAALSSLIPVTVSGLGARELIYIEVLQPTGVEPETAVVLSLMHLAVMSASALLLGFLGIVARGRQRVVKVESDPAS